MKKKLRLADVIRMIEEIEGVRVCLGTIYAWVKTGWCGTKLGASRLGKRWFFTEDGVVKFLEAMRRGGPA